jgi:hypothetical protein
MVLILLVAFGRISPASILVGPACAVGSILLSARLSLTVADLVERLRHRRLERTKTAEQPPISLVEIRPSG